VKTFLNAGKYATKMKILLIQPPHISGGIARQPDSFPLGLACIATVLSKEHEVEVLDIWGGRLTDSEVIEKISKINHDLVGISALCTQYPYIKWLSKEIRKHFKGPMILGGLLATYSTDIVLNNTDIDICIIGEGESTIPELLKNLCNLNEVNGIAFKKGSKIIKTKPREYIKDLDSIPFPNRDFFPVETYINSSIYKDDGRKAEIIAGRGCPYNCFYCSKGFEGVRLRSVDNIIEEIKFLKTKYSIKTVCFADELVVVNKKRTYELCEKIKPLGVRWVCQGRLNIVDLPLLKTMKKSGCKRIGYGIESGSQKILDNMNKQVKVEQALQGLVWTQQAGIALHPQMMFGMIGETKETLNETIEFCRKAHIAPQGMFSTTPLPHTPLYDYALKKGLIKDEEKYLEGLPGTFRLYVNLTDFNDDDYLKLKSETEAAIVKNYSKYRRKHPSLLWKDYSHKAKRAYWYIQDYGLVTFLKSLMKVIRNDRDILFTKEMVA